MLTAVHCQGSTDDWGRTIGLACYRKVSEERFREMLNKNVDASLLDRCKYDGRWSPLGIWKRKSGDAAMTETPNVLRSSRVHATGVEGWSTLIQSMFCEPPRRHPSRPQWKPQRAASVIHHMITFVSTLAMLGLAPFAQCTDQYRRCILKGKQRWTDV